MRRTVLFVDDETRILDGLARMLRPQRDRIEVVTAPGGREALSILANRQIDAVVSDMRMPCMDGAALLAEVRHLYPFPVRIILSGQSDQDTLLRAVAVTHQFLSKPCEPQLLVATVLAACAWRDLLSAHPYHRVAVSRLVVLPSPQTVVTRLDAELAEAQPSLRRVASLIAADPGMAAKVLQLVSSSFFGQPRRVDPDEAVRLLGLDLIRALRSRDTLAVASDDRRESQNTTVAAVARAVCGCLGGNERAVADAGLAGLLHGCGSLVEGSLPVDEPAMAASLLGMWGLSDGPIKAILHQRSPSAAPPAEQVVAGALHAALVLQGQLAWDGAWLASQGDAAGMITRMTEASKLATLPQVVNS